MMIDAITLAFVAGIVSLLYAGFLTFQVIKAPSGDKKMQEISGAIREGANAFLMRQYKTLLPIVVVLVIVIGYFVDLDTAIEFVVGVVSSELAGYIGMQV